MNDQQQQFEYNKWQTGIADSPEDGFANIVCCNIEKYPNAIIPGYQTVQTNSTQYGTSSSLNITGNGTGNQITFNGVGTGNIIYVGQAVQFSHAFGSITTNTIYYILTTDGATYMTVSATLGGALSSGSAVTSTGAIAGYKITSVDMAQIVDIKSISSINVVGATSYTGVINPYVFAIDTNGRVWWQANNMGTVSGATFASLTQGPWYLIFYTTTSAPAISMGLNIYVDSGLAGTEVGNVWLFFTAGVTQYCLCIAGVNSGNSSISQLSPFNASFDGYYGAGHSWTNINNLNTSNYHRGIFSQQSGFMYWTDGAAVYGFGTVAGQIFDPSNSGTFSYNYYACQLPLNETSTCLEILGSNLYIGGLSTSSIYPFTETVQAISSSSSSSFGFTGYQIPIRVGEIGVFRMKNIGNILYILAGVRGIIYYTTGQTVLALRKIPEYITGGSVQWGDIEKIDGNLLFSFVGTQVNSSGVTQGGVGKLQLTAQAYMSTEIATGTLTIDQIPASGVNTQLVNSLFTYQNINLLNNTGTTPLECYYLGSLNSVPVTPIGVIDVTNPAQSRTDGSSYIECKLEHASTYTGLRQFTQLALKLLQPIALGTTTEIIVQSRNALNSSYSTILTANSTNISNGIVNGSRTNPFTNSNFSVSNIYQQKIILISGSLNAYPVLHSTITE